MNSAQKDWTTKAGYRAVAVLRDTPRSEMWYCGYVCVPVSHPLHGVQYSDECPALVPFVPSNEASVGKRGIVNIFCAALNGSLRPRPDDCFDVHGSLTFSGPLIGGEFSESDWWFGFDCRHCDDTIEKCNLAYVVGECESLAEQLARVDREPCS